jgi:hypothetical protein
MTNPLIIRQGQVLGWGAAGVSRWKGFLAAALAFGTATAGAQTQDRPEGPRGWDCQRAAQYLDDRMDWWLGQAKPLKEGEAKAACISCHSVAPYLLARPALRQTVQAAEPALQETRLLADVARRVEAASPADPAYARADKPAPASEAVLSALLLAAADARQSRREPSDLTLRAFRQMWSRQRADGSWDWVDLAQEPDESADSRYNGTALAAIALATGPGLSALPEGGTPEQTARLRGYLNGQFATQNLYRRAWMLVASTRLSGLLNLAQRQELLAELQAAQNADGGWALLRLGPWRWSKPDSPATPNAALEPSLLALRSDAYATGFVAYALRQAGMSPADPALKKALDWLKANQKEGDNPRWKYWPAPSLNHGPKSGGEARNRLVMADAATAYAVLALRP